MCFVSLQPADVSDSIEIRTKEARGDVTSAGKNVRRSMANFVGHVIEIGGAERMSKHDAAADG